MPDSGVEVESGDNLRLKCVARGSPQPSIEWTRSFDQNFGVKGNSLIIEDIKPSDEDTYNCKAINSEGVAVREIKVRVKGGDLDSDGTQYDDNQLYESIREARFDNYIMGSSSTDHFVCLSDISLIRQSTPLWR